MRRKPGPAKGSRRQRSTPIAAESTAGQWAASRIGRKLADLSRVKASRQEPQLSASVTSRDAPQPFTSLENLLPQRNFTELAVSSLAATEISTHSAEANTSLGQESNHRSPIDPQLHPNLELQLYVNLPSS